MGSRLDLQTLLEAAIGSRNVYFQPPESLKLQFPAIIYNLSDIDVINADGVKYKTKKRYTAIVIDKNPDSPLVDKLMEFDYCSFERAYTSDGLNHYVFSIFF